MNFPYRVWSALRRRFPAALQVASTNLILDRDFRVERPFTLFTYSILFKGNGFLRVDGREYSLRAPCAYIAYPGEFIDCGPSSPADRWHHLYFDYEPKWVRRLEAMGLADKAARTMPVEAPAPLWALAEELCALSRTFPLEDVVDRVDRLCERIILESRLPSEPEIGERRRIARVLEEMHRSPHKPFNLGETARHAGMSEATFRRHWLETVGMTPRRYQEQLRMQEAGRKLVESTLSVAQIASLVGFEDPFYFSRRFLVIAGVSPREYRRRHRP